MLSSLIILMAIGTVVVMKSAANISMSRKYSGWSADYYWLDYAAQDELSKIDKNVLSQGENIARYYLQNSYYRYDSVDQFPSGNEMSTYLIVTFTGADELQTLIHTAWQDIENMLAGVPVPSETQQTEYDLAMQAFASKAFEVVYYTFINSNLYDRSGPSVIENIDTDVYLENPGWLPNIAYYAGGGFDDYYAAIADMPRLKVIARETEPGKTKMVEVAATIVTPGFSAIQQTKYFAAKVNPLYLNALSVLGSVTFEGGGSINIDGDVVSNNLNAAGVTLGLNEGNSYGIKTAPGSSVTVNIRGNVSSAGDLHLFGNGSTINVSGYPAGFADTMLLKKNKLYSEANEYFFDFLCAEDAILYTEENTAPGIVPYIYKDSAGGNVYCNNLAIESGVTGGRINVSGHVWTQDDIQNDGRDNNRIYVAKNYIGMRSDANNGDPNGSSAIINNAYLSNGHITIGGDYIIPGTAWYKFSGVGSPGSGVVYYQTAESLFARAGEYFQLYTAESGTAGSVFKTYYVDAEEYYSLFDRRASSPASDTLKDRIDRFSGLVPSIPDAGSGIDVKPDAERYLLGVGVNDDGVLVKSGSSNANAVAYSEVSGSILPAVFKAKTKDYGTNGFSFKELIDESAAMTDPVNHFYYYPGNATVDVSAVSSGIIYCNGNLTLTGTGTFRGSVVCAGNLTVRSGVNVRYDESVILDVLGLSLNPDGTYDFSTESGSRAARRFFSPGVYSAYTVLGIEKITSLSTGSGERDSEEISRYIINSWKEMKQ